MGTFKGYYNYYRSFGNTQEKRFYYRDIQETEGYSRTIIRAKRNIANLNCWWWNEKHPSTAYQKSWKLEKVKKQWAKKRTYYSCWDCWYKNNDKICCHEWVYHLDYTCPHYLHEDDFWPTLVSNLIKDSLNENYEE